jgi:transcriptional regulator with XRE-family HTH domain
VTPKQFETYLKRNKLSQKKAAEHLGVSRNTIAYYLSGKWPIPTVFEFALDELARRLGEGDL